MGSLKVLAFASAAAVMTVSAAHAADMPLMPAPAPMMPVAAPAEFATGWYLRGDVGVGVQNFKSFDYTQTNSQFVWPSSWQVENKGLGDAFIVGAGIGYQLNSWLRFDVTGEYRSTAKITAVGSYAGARDFCTTGGGADGKCFDVYDGHHSASVFLANAYIDLGTWARLTPFIGAGVGVVKHAVNNFWDLGLNADGSTGRGFAPNSTSDWQLAWAVHAGVAYDVTQNVKVELAYRYLNMGHVNTAVIGCNGCGTFGPLAYYTLRNVDSHDFKLGVRWLLDAPVPVEPAYAPMPLVRKG